jgi:hypothetical protein
MKPSRIHEILDLALTARKKGFMFNPNFISHAGIGKTEHIASWVAQKRLTNPNFVFISLRTAYCESPDFLGLPNQEIIDGHKVTTHYTPEFWPRDPEAEGVIFIDEWTRSTTAVMNCLMSMTDSTRSIGPRYTLPKNIIIVGANNPESSDYDTNTADTALKDRFEHFEIEYDHNGFVDYMERNKWCDQIQTFVKSGAWVFKEPSAIGKDGKYLSPRTWSKLNSAHQSGAMDDRSLHRQICMSVLGKDIGGEFWKFVWTEAPVTAGDLIKDKKAALKKLKEQSSPTQYKGDYISITTESIVKHYGGKTPKEGEISEELMVEVACVIPKDLSIQLLRDCGLKGHGGNVSNFFKEIQGKYPELVEALKANVKVNKASK